MRDALLLVELSQLAVQLPRGVYVLPSADNLAEWHGVLFVRNGAYRGAVLHFLMSVPAKYPYDCPAVAFRTSLFHPQVDIKSGQLLLAEDQAKSPSGRYSIVGVLKCVKEIFYKLRLQPAANPSAAELCRSDREQFDARVKESVRDSVVRATSSHPSSLISIQNEETAELQRFREQLRQASLQRISSGALTPKRKGREPHAAPQTPEL